MVVYGDAALAQKAITSFKASGGSSICLTILDNSREKLDLKLVDRHIHYPFNPGLSRVWNWAVAMCETPWIHLTNQDVKFIPGWLEVITDKNHMKKARVHGKFYSFFAHRSVFKDVGWFDEMFVTSLSEDTDYVRRMFLVNEEWCKKCHIQDFIQHEQDKENPIYEEGYNQNYNRAVYKRKWGDPPLLKTEDDEERSEKSPTWMVPDYYPHAVLPSV